MAKLDMNDGSILSSLGQEAALLDTSTPNLFYFWDNLDTLSDRFHDNIRFAMDAYPDWTFALMTDDFGRDLLARDWPEIAAAYDDIWIPACRSDIVRMAALYAYGGWYIDADTLPVGDLRPLTGDKPVIVFRDNRRRLIKRGDVMNGFLYMPPKSPLAKAMMEGTARNLRDKTDVYQVMEFAGPYMLARLIKEMGEDSVVKLWQSRVYKRYNTELVGDEPLFEHTVDDSASSWRIIQNFGVMRGLEPNWDGFPPELRPRFVHVLRRFVNAHDMHAQLVELGHQKPLYMNRPGFVKLYEECQAKIA
ncbi:glycosyltransferase family 32 protein [Pseudooctadecabacter sp.]|uniref:glycosyltransferase family 32 protein n=1 Tax=Pseudooctadecabacter sp. TaxID=1966338 RepID=UPI0035C83622